MTTRRTGQTKTAVAGGAEAVELSDSTQPSRNLAATCFDARSGRSSRLVLTRVLAGGEPQRDP